LRPLLRTGHSKRGMLLRLLLPPPLPLLLPPLPLLWPPLLP
jgi:hypothetical protein